MTDPQRVMVTAAGSGIGRAIARAFADAGASVHICDADEALLELATADYPEIVAECLDVTDEVALERWFDDVLDDLDGLDVLVNNAGIAGPTAAIEDMDYDGWQRCLAVCLDSQFLACRRAVPVMKDQGSGSIINISSTAGLYGLPYRTPMRRRNGASSASPSRSPPKPGAGTSASTPSVPAPSRAPAWSG
jgi:NAD(P)-dependent dehydrogenase (short-subunit alcohol dehydrogenase family)